MALNEKLEIIVTCFNDKMARPAHGIDLFTIMYWNKLFLEINSRIASKECSISFFYSSQ